MAELQPPEGPVNGAGGGGSSENVGLGTKRQRRPSVRLGDIGGQPATLSYDSYVRRTKQWTGSDTSKYHRHPSHSHSHSHKDTGAAGGKSSKTRPLTNLGNGGGGGAAGDNNNNNSHETLEIDDTNKNGSADANFDLLSIRKAKRGGATKRVRSNWVSKPDQETNPTAATTAVTAADKFSGEDGGGGDEGFRDFDPEGSQSPLKDHSPVHSLENPAVDLRQNSDRGGHGIEKEGLFLGKRRSVRTRVSESRDHNDGVELELDGPSDTDARDWKCGGTSTDRNGGGLGRGRFWSLEDGVRMWLNGLGLGQYAAVFEIHEVDEEVLPQLTLEDLKDMGINAVGSRRKLYSAIQKLAKGFS